MSYPPSMQRFLSAKQFAVVGASSDRSKWSNKVLRWYQDRQFPVTPVNPTTAQIEGLDTVKEASALPELPSTSISVIINPKAGLPIVKQLFGTQRENWPHAIWFQPGAFDEGIQRYLTEQGADDRVVPYGECILVKGDSVLASLQRTAGKSSL